MNQVEILGNLTRDPVIRATSTGKAMARFSVAVNRTYRTPAGEEKNIGGLRQYCGLETDGRKRRKLLEKRKPGLCDGALQYPFL